jgi:hypothetical protein
MRRRLRTLPALVDTRTAGVGAGFDGDAEANCGQDGAGVRPGGHISSSRFYDRAMGCVGLIRR